MESVLLVEFGRDDGVKVVAEHPRSDYGQNLGSLCFPYPELFANEYRRQGGMESPMLLVTEKNAPSIVESRILAYTRRFCLPCVESGRFDVGARRAMAGIVMTRTSDASSISGRARSMLAALEGELMMGGNAEDVVKRLFRPSSCPRPGLPRAEVGGLCRRLRSSADVRRLASAVLCERRVIFYGSHELDVSRCVLGAAAIPEIAFGPEVLWYPHVVAPLLSTSTLAYAGSPSPYVVGIHASKLESTVEEFVGHSFRDDIVLVDVDDGVVGCLGAACLHLGNVDEGFCGEFNATIGASIKRGDSARRDGKVHEKKRKEMARKATMDKVSSSARKAANAAISTARGRLFSRGGGGKAYKNNLDEEEEVVDEVSAEEEDDERFFFDHYFDEEDDSCRDVVDAALCDAFGSFLRAILGTRQFVLPNDIQGALDDARELFVADRAAKSPGLEAFARDFSQSQMFAAWALERSTTTRKTEEGEKRASPPPPPPRDEVALVLSSLSKRFEETNHLDAALSAFGGACRHAPIPAALELALALFPKVECAATLRRTAAVIMDDDASRRRRRRPALTHAERDARLGAVAIVLATLVYGPPSCVATVANQVVKSLRRSATSDEDVDVRDCSSLALRLCVDIDGSLKEARRHFLLRRDSFPFQVVHPFPKHLIETGSKFPDFAQLHAASAPGNSDGNVNGNSFPELVDLLGIQETERESSISGENYPPPPLPMRPSSIATPEPMREDSSSDSAASDSSPSRRAASDPFDNGPDDFFFKRPPPPSRSSQPTLPASRSPPPDLLDTLPTPSQRASLPPPPTDLLLPFESATTIASRPPPSADSDHLIKNESSMARRRPPPPPPTDVFAASSNGGSFGRPSPPPPPSDQLFKSGVPTKTTSPARPAPPPLPTHNVGKPDSAHTNVSLSSTTTTTKATNNGSRPSPPPLPTALRRPVPPAPPLPPRRD